MSCFKLNSGDQPSSRRRAPAKARQAFSEAGRSGDGGRATARDHFDVEFGPEGTRFSKETSALVRQASNVAAKVRKQRERMSRVKQKSSVFNWNLLRRRSSSDSKNDETPSSPATGTAKRQTSLGGSASPKLSLDSARKNPLNFRRQTTDAGARQQGRTRPATASGRVSIVAKDWDSVHKVHDPDSATGGVYIGEDAPAVSRMSRKVINGEVQNAFSAMKISESTDRQLSMIDDESK